MPHPLWSDLFLLRKKRNPALHDALHSSVLFETLSPEEIRTVAGMVYERIYEPGEVVFRQDDRGIGMYLIVSGSISIQSSESEVARLETGSFFGELALVDPENIRGASAQAITRSSLIGFFKPDLEEILERRPEIGVKILLQLARVLGSRLTRTTGLYQTAQSRLEQLGALAEGNHEKT